MYAHRVSNAAANMVALNLHHDLSKKGIAVAALDLGHHKFDPQSCDCVTPDGAASGLIARIDGLTLGTSGEFWHYNGTRLAW
jgi:2-glutathionyl-2-methylbut-3-en-1-ol dehydrogenase